MTVDPPTPPTQDRLAEIERRWKGAYLHCAHLDHADNDIKWLVAEVKRLNLENPMFCESKAED